MKKPNHHLHEIFFYSNNVNISQEETMAKFHQEAKRFQKDLNDKFHKKLIFEKSIFQKIRHQLNKFASSYLGSSIIGIAIVILTNILINQISKFDSSNGNNFYTTTASSLLTLATIVPAAIIFMIDRESLKLNHFAPIQIPRIMVSGFSLLFFWLSSFLTSINSIIGSKNKFNFLNNLDNFLLDKHGKAIALAGTLGTIICSILLLWFIVRQLNPDNSTFRAVEKLLKANKFDIEAYEKVVRELLDLSFTEETKNQKDSVRIRMMGLAALASTEIKLFEKARYIALEAIGYLGQDLISDRQLALDSLCALYVSVLPDNFDWDSDIPHKPTLTVYELEELKKDEPDEIDHADDAVAEMIRLVEVALVTASSSRRITLNAIRCIEVLGWYFVKKRSLWIENLLKLEFNEEHFLYVLPQLLSLSNDADLKQSELSNKILIEQVSRMKTSGLLTFLEKLKFKSRDNQKWFASKEEKELSWLKNHTFLLNTYLLLYKATYEHSRDIELTTTQVNDLVEFRFRIFEELRNIKNKLFESSLSTELDKLTFLRFCVTVSEELNTTIRKALSQNAYSAYIDVVLTLDLRLLPWEECIEVFESSPEFEISSIKIRELQKRFHYLLAGLDKFIYQDKLEEKKDETNLARSFFKKHEFLIRHFFEKKFEDSVRVKISEDKDIKDKDILGFKLDAPYQLYRIVLLELAKIVTLQELETPEIFRVLEINRQEFYQDSSTQKYENPGVRNFEQLFEAVSKLFQFRLGSIDEAQWESRKKQYQKFKSKVYAAKYNFSKLDKEDAELVSKLRETLMVIHEFIITRIQVNEKDSRSGTKIGQKSNSMKKYNELEAFLNKPNINWTRFKPKVQHYIFVPKKSGILFSYDIHEFLLNNLLDGKEQFLRIPCSNSKSLKSLVKKETDSNLKECIFCKAGHQTDLWEVLCINHTYITGESTYKENRWFTFQALRISRSNLELLEAQALELTSEKDFFDKAWKVENQGSSAQIDLRIIDQVEYQLRITDEVSQKSASSVSKLARKVLLYEAKKSYHKNGNPDMVRALIDFSKSSRHKID